MIRCLLTGHYYLETYEPPYDPFLTCARCGRTLIGAQGARGRDQVNADHVLVFAPKNQRSLVRDRVYGHQPFQGPKLVP